MTKGWERKKLREVCHLINGRAYSKPELLNDGKYRVLRVGNFFTNDHWYYSDLELDESKYCDTGDLLYAWSASFGPRIWNAGKVIYHYHIWKVIHDPAQLEQKFLFYYFEWDTDKVKEQQGTGTTITHVSMGSMNDRVINFPPLSEQRRIVGVLDGAFAGLAIAKRNTEKNVQNARALFESHLHSVFTHRNKGWVEKKLGALAEFKNGLNYTRESKGQTLPVVGVGDFQSNTIVPLEQLQTARIDGKLSPQYAIQAGDILTVRSNGSKNLVGRSMLVPEVSRTTSYSGFIIRVRVNPAEVFPAFLLHLMKSRPTRDRLVRDGGGANISNINQTKLAALPVSLPSIAEQKKIVAQLDALAAETQRLTQLYKQKLAALTALKKSLLHQAFTGEL